MELVYMDGKKEPYTLSSIVAECTGLQHHTITKTIRKHQVRFEQFGKVGFKIQAMESGQNTKDYILNEQQATLLVTFLKNTEQVANFKTNLVKAFLETWEAKPKHAHSTMNNLLLKAVTDMNAKQLVKSRGGYNGIDSLTSDELEQYQALEDMVIAMIGLNMSYQEIKAMAFRNKKKHAKEARDFNKKGLAITTPQSLSH